MDFQKEQQLRSRLAGNIRRLRMSRSPCLSQKMLAKKLGVTQKSISRYENARCLPPAHVLVALFMERLPQNMKKKKGTSAERNSKPAENAD